MTNASMYNEIPRQRGTFLWRQVYHMQHEGAHTIIGASFDDFNSSTALMPATTLSRLLPKEGRFLALDADGDASLPPDWYLRICGMVGEAMRGEKRIATDLMPKKELDDYWAMRPKYEEDMYAEAGGSGAAMFDAGPSNAGTADSGMSSMQAEPSAGPSEASSAPRQPMRSGTVDFDNLAPAPPPYSLEAEAGEANVPQANPVEPVNTVQAPSASGTLPAVAARPANAQSASPRPNPQSFPNITPSGLQNPVINARPLPTNLVNRPAPAAQSTLPVASAGSSSMQPSPQIGGSSSGPVPSQTLPPPDSRPRPAESRPWSPFRRNQSPNSRPVAPNQPTLPGSSRPMNQSPSPGRMNSPLATPPFSNAVFPQTGPGGSGQASPQRGSSQVQLNQPTSNSLDDGMVGGFAAPGLGRQSPTRPSDLPPPPVHPSLNPNFNNNISGLNMMNPLSDPSRPNPFPNPSMPPVSQPLYGQPEPNRPPMHNYSSGSLGPDYGFPQAGIEGPSLFPPPGFSQPRPGYPQLNMGPPGFTPQGFSNLGPPNNAGPSNYSNPSTPGFAPPGQYPNYGSQRPNSTPPVSSGGAGAFSNASYGMPQPPRQDSAASISSTGYSNMPVAYSQGPQSSKHGLLKFLG